MENQIIQIDNQQLEDKQLERLQKIREAGNYSAIGFAKRIKDFEKIMNLDSEETRPTLGLIFTRVFNLSGFKGVIDDIHKQDIVEMILVKYKHFSIEEIDYAFRYDRYSGDPIEHFQLFNSEYVAKVLKRYKDYIIQIKKDNNISHSISKVNFVSDEEKRIIHEEFLKVVYEEIKEFNISDSAWLLWDKVYNKHGKSIEVQQRLFRMQKFKFLRFRPTNFDFIKGGKKSVQNICRSIMVSHFLKHHLSSFEEFKKRLNE